MRLSPSAIEPGSSFAEALLVWYKQSARSFLWRQETPNPYHVWLSEMMLQQTTTQTVTPYFEAFTKRWGSFQHLSQASLSDVLQQWQGLGYYRRAENVWRCAKEVATNHQGVLPQEVNALLKLPGIGPYTAAAISTIAFEKSAVAVDGNIARVFSRLLCLKESATDLLKVVRLEAKSFLPQDSVLKNKSFPRPYGDYTQALMDLGASICTPQAPKCLLCPVRSFCKAARLGTQGEFPRKKEKKAQPHRYGAFFFVVCKKDGTFLMQKEQNALLKGLWRPLTSAWGAQKQEWTPPLASTWQNIGTVQHVFTHFKLCLELFYTQVPDKNVSHEGTWVSLADLEDYPVSTLVKKALKCYKGFVSPKAA
ncbi:MAG: A/G-specific adenine glycosylase [Holosporaceae bacterium]